MGSKAVKIDEELYRKAEELAARKGASIKEIVEDALAKYFGLVEDAGDDGEIKNVKVVKNWTLKYPATCAYCKRPLKAGEVVVREIIELEDERRVNNFYHPECYLFSTDSAMAKYYVKKRQFEKIIRALKKRADELADAISEAETRRKLLDIAEEVQRLAKQHNAAVIELTEILREYTFAKSDEERERLWQEYNEIKARDEEMRRRLRELGDKLEEIAAAMSLTSTKKRSEEVWSP